jgi:acyl-CoA synthetase (AMP-forming)/AMP-acid ligase II
LPFNKAVTLWADREALVEGDERFTYKQFGQRVAALCNALIRLGLSKGARIAILAPNGLRYMECYYATALAGFVLVPINHRLSPEEIASIFADAEVDVLIGHSDFVDRIEKAMEQTPSLNKIIWLPAKTQSSFPKAKHYERILSENAGLPLPDVDLQADDLAQLYYTSGTTGKPKGVMLSHCNVAFHALVAAYELGLSEEDVWLHVAPMFHLADAWALFSVTWAGGRHVFEPYFESEEVLAVMEEEEITITAMVPTMANNLLHHKDISRRSFKNLRLLMTAGAPIAPELVRKIVDVFGCDYRQFYGMTETSPFLTIATPKAHLRDLPKDQLLSIKSKTGRSFLGVELKVVRDDGSEVEANNEEIGEIIARGPSVTKGYWRKPAATGEAIRDGWLHTGDLAVIDKEGYVNIVDRKKDMIITGGENVYSTEVEHALHEHPSVLECAVFGKPDPDWGETVIATVVLKPDHTADEKTLINFVKSKIAGYKAPKVIYFLPELPKTGSGKIFKRGLKEQYAKTGFHSK